MTVGEAEYVDNHPVESGSSGDRVWHITECRGDLNNDGSINTFDINGFTAVLSSVEDYEDLYPGLEGSIDWHADCDCNGTVNTFDIQAFLDRLETGECDGGGGGGS